TLWPVRLLLIFCLFVFNKLYSQVTFPVNGIAEPSSKPYAFTNATIYKDANTVLRNATLVIRDRKIVAIGNNIPIPADLVIIDCKGKYLYPSFIDIYSDYGIPAPQRQQGGFNFNAPAQFVTNTKGAYGWNQAIKPEVNASAIFD